MERKLLNCIKVVLAEKNKSNKWVLSHNEVNRRYGIKEYGFIIDYIGIREEMKKAMKRYGGDVGLQEDLEVAHEVLQNKLPLLQERLSGLVFDRFCGNNDLARLQFIQEAAEYILASGVERVMDEGVEENIFSDSFTKEVEEIKMPFTKFQTLCKLVAKAIKAYSRTNKIQAEHFLKMLEDTIDAYNARDKLTFTNDVTQNVLDNVYDIV